MTIEQQLNDLKSKSDCLNTLKIENATKLKGLEEEKEKLLAEVRNLGIEPTKIEEVLKSEEAVVQAEIIKFNDQLTKVLEQINGL